MAIDPASTSGTSTWVADLDRALGFWRDVLGFEEQARYGDQAVFISAGGYHHHIGLNTWSPSAALRRRRGTRASTTSRAYPDKASLADALRRLLEAGISLDGASDHGVSEALYLRDPDGNGVELYRDRPREEWPTTTEGELAMMTRPLDVRALLAEAP